MNPIDVLFAELIKALPPNTMIVIPIKGPPYLIKKKLPKILKTEEF